MHTEDTVLAGTSKRPDGTSPLMAVVPLAPRADTATPRAGTVALDVVGGGPSDRAFSVRYQLDQVTHRWVASIMDDSSGEIVQTVPSTQVLHQLAGLRWPPLDLLA